MKKNEMFIQSLYRTITRDLEDIKNEYYNPKMVSSITGYGKRALELFNNLPEVQKEIFFEIIEQTMIDTISTFLGIIDGNITLSGNVEPPKLYYDGKDVSDEMQDLFLEYIEDMESD